MFRVSYLVGKFNDRRGKSFTAYASAQLFFLQKFHEERPGLRMEVLYDEKLENDVVEEDMD